MKIGTVKRRDGLSQLVVSVDSVDLMYSAAQKRLVGVKRDTEVTRYFEALEAIKFAEALEANVKIVASVLALIQAAKKELFKYKHRTVETADTEHSGGEAFDITLYNADNYDSDEFVAVTLRINVEAPCGDTTLLTADDADWLASLLRKAAARIKDSKPKRGKTNGK